MNSAATITDCLASVNAQTVTVEHLIVDGASTDDTLKIVRRMSPSARVVSEPDNGIYDAMNKGIRLATGDIVGILNSDDFYAGPQVLDSVNKIFADPGIDACYSDLIYVNPKKTDRIVRYWQSCPYRDGLFEKLWVPPHPTLFVRRAVYERFGLFDLSFHIAADFELMLRFLARHKIRSFYLPQVTVHMRTGGESNKSVLNIIRQNIEIFRAMKKNALHVSPLYPLYKLTEKIPQFFNRPSL